jgi:hypothetical protein
LDLVAAQRPLGALRELPGDRQMGFSSPSNIVEPHAVLGGRARGELDHRLVVLHDRILDDELRSLTLAVGARRRAILSLPFASRSARPGSSNPVDEIQATSTTFAPARQLARRVLCCSRGGDDSGARTAHEMHLHMLIARHKDELLRRSRAKREGCPPDELDCWLPVLLDLLAEALEGEANDPQTHPGQAASGTPTLDRPAVARVVAGARARGPASPRVEDSFQAAT